MNRYNPHLRTGQPDRGLNLPDEATRRMAVRLITETDCAAGRHRTETDAETGDEVCRFCGAVVEP